MRAVEDNRRPPPGEHSERAWKNSVNACAVAANARALLLALAKSRLTQQLVPLRLVVERNVEQAAPPVRTGRGVSLWQESQQGSDARSGSTTALERIEQADGEKRGRLRCFPRILSLHSSHIR